MSNYTAMGIDLGVPEDSSLNIEQVLVVFKGKNADNQTIYSILTSSGLHQVEVDELARFAYLYSTELVRYLILGSKPVLKDENTDSRDISG